MTSRPHRHDSVSDASAGAADDAAATAPTALRASLDAAFRAERRALFLIAYRMTGSTSDADDVVQETFERALARPPARTDLAWRPWLQRVAVNLARDALRRRRRRPYLGPWLPAPLETDAFAAALAPAAYEPSSTAGRYELLESVSYAFLVALEALTPAQRAVLVLCDVLEHSGREAAQALGLGEANVRQTLVRARRVMAAYDRERLPPGAEQNARTQASLGSLLGCVATGDTAGLAALLADDVATWNDGGGQYAAARRPVCGRAKVARFLLRISKLGVPRVRFANVNGMPALLAVHDAPRKKIAPRYVMLLDVDAQGKLRRLWTVLAPDKLRGVGGVP